MLLECLDAQGTFLQQSTFYSIGFPYEVNRERGVGGGYGGKNGEDVRKYRSGETLFKLLLQEWNIYFAFFLFINFCFTASIANTFFLIPMFFLSNYL